LRPFLCDFIRNQLREPTAEVDNNRQATNLFQPYSGSSAAQAGVAATVFAETTLGQNYSKKVLKIYKSSLDAAAQAALSLLRISGVSKPTISSGAKSATSSSWKPPSQPMTTVSASQSEMKWCHAVLVKRTTLFELSDELV